MTRQSISLTEPNDKWLQEKVASKEYSSKSELVNDLIRQERRRADQLEALRGELIKGEESGHSSKTKEQVLAQIKAGLK
ncbi:type II toxin-antitoxin system ParD family antitoxin [Algoriphagus sp. H41]|uniref:Type II toxin-antitoxin system ParD family antitoxin n=1 Tax=Algoriphagus oliviformis TaxID=2811231 RepID=A0ABS3BYP7_9BACT|nr:type II toxin-antitoxin system ParD family antitoxin [Algoriphagus oliviformis]MBN7809807.1 type II toxin-antitoxin system ParD family antitoxin [Algoriphagus oliviformis]